jgi:hypothetical protein
VPAEVSRSRPPETINPVPIRGTSHRRSVDNDLGRRRNKMVPSEVDRRLVEVSFVTGFSLVALDEVVLYQLQINPPLTTNPEGRQLPQPHAAIDRRLRDPKVRGQLFQRDHFGVGNSSVGGNLMTGSVRWFAPIVGGGWMRRSQGSPSAGRTSNYSMQPTLLSSRYLGRRIAAICLSSP